MAESTGEATAEPRVLFYQRGLTGVKLSNDGRFIAVSYMSDNYPTIQACVKIYDCENRSFYSVKAKNLKEAAILAGSEGYYLIAQKYLAQKYSIVIYVLI